MFNNVPERFLPPVEYQAELIYDELLAYDRERFGYVENRILNATAELLDRGIAEHGWGDRIAIYDANKNEAWTYDRLQEQVNRFGNVLKSLGVEPGDRVMWRFGEVPEAAVVQLAIWKVGAINVPSAMPERAREITYLANDTEAKVIVTLAEGLDQVEKALPELKTVKAVVVVPDTDHPEFHSYDRLIARSSGVLEAYPTRPDDAASIFYTGGTTGRPKGCIHSHAAEVIIADLHCGVARAATKDDVLFTHAPLGHAFGNGEKINFAIRFGAATVYRERVTPVEAWDLLRRYSITIMAGAPTMYRMMLEHLPKDYKIGDRLSLRTVVSTGEMLPQVFYEKWNEITGIPIHNAVGMTPMRHIFCESILQGEKIAPAHSVGKPLPGYQYKLVNDKGETVPIGTIGRLAVKGPTGITYWNHLHPDMPERQRKDTVDGWSLLDDVYTQDEQGFLYFVSRTDNMIVTAGRQVAAPEVEEVLNQHPSVKRVAVVGVADDIRGNVVKAFIELNPGYEPIEELKNEIVQFAKENMALYKQPRIVEFIDKIPTDGVGKIQRRLLRELSVEK